MSPSKLNFFRSRSSRPSVPNVQSGETRLTWLLARSALCAGLLLGLYAPASGIAAPSLTFSIDAAAKRSAISPQIYGINGDASSLQDPQSAASRPTLLRLGGNRWTAFNWESNDSNAGLDFCFENDDYLTASTTPGDAVKPSVEAATAKSIPAIVTIPTVGFVSKDRLHPNGGDDPNANPPKCPDSVKLDPATQQPDPNYLTKRFRPSGPVGPLTDVPDPAATSVYQNQYVDWLKLHEPTANLLYSLDNEPDLWSSTHSEVHPAPASYDEVAQRDVDYANAIKDVVPAAQVLGPVVSGWEGLASLGGSPSDTQNGNFTDYWLSRVKALSAGRKLIDTFDTHWYPEPTPGTATNLVAGTDTSAPIVAERERRPLSLWNTDYQENSFITNDLGTGPIMLIPRLKQQIKSSGLSMNVGITEWNYGAAQDISGAIADADALGIFGREGLQLATYFPLAADNSFAYGAFAAYRNFDGHGASFGDTSIQADTTDVMHSSVYASVNASSPSHIYVIAINKNPAGSPTTSTAINLSNAGTVGDATVYTLTASGGPSPKPAGVLHAADAHSYVYDMPPQSVSIIDVPTTTSNTTPPPLPGTVVIPPTGPAALPPISPGGTLSNVFSLVGVTSGSNGLIDAAVRTLSPGILLGQASTTKGARVAAGGAKKRLTTRVVRYGTGSTTAPSGGVIHVKIAPTTAARRLLHRTGKLRVSLKLTFTPSGGRPNTQTARVTVGRKRGHGR